jgi:hypothetical protein
LCVKKGRKILLGQERKANFSQGEIRNSLLNDGFSGVMAEELHNNCGFVPGN